MEKRVNEMTASELRGTIQGAIITANLALGLMLGALVTLVRLYVR